LTTVTVVTWRCMNVVMFDNSNSSYLEVHECRNV